MGRGADSARDLAEDLAWSSLIFSVFASPEGVILKKLEYYREGGSDKHLRDIAGILRISGDQVDFAYIGDWATRLDLAEIWAKVRKTATEERPED